MSQSKSVRWTMVAANGAMLGATLGAGCHRDRALGPPDSFAVYAPFEVSSGAAPRSAAGLTVVSPLAPDDPRAEPLYRELSIGFAAEVLRTDYLAKQLVRDAVIDGRRYPDSARAAADEPTAFVVGGAGNERTGWGFALRKTFGASDHPNVSWIALDRYPDHDRALPQTLAGLIGRTAAARVAGTDGPARGALLEGYARALEVIAREWRVGEGADGAIAPASGTREQRDLFAAVRENRYAVGSSGAPRPPAELLADPGLAATVLYRLAQSRSVGRKVAPPEIYAPFVADRIPPGISPAAVLGPFRNFQAKLLSAWARAVLEGHAPRDIVDLVEAYARALPAERGEVFRIFVMTTYGATIKPGGVRLPPGDAGAVLPELTALAAQAAAGKVSARAAVSQ